jgi:hypothetical protein
MPLFCLVHLSPRGNCPFLFFALGGYTANWNALLEARQLDLSGHWRVYPNECVNGQ